MQPSKPEAESFWSAPFSKDGVALRLPGNPTETIHMFFSMESEDACVILLVKRKSVIPYAVLYWICWSWSSLSLLMRWWRWDPFLTLHSSGRIRRVLLWMATLVEFIVCPSESVNEWVLLVEVHQPCRGAVQETARVHPHVFVLCNQWSTNKLLTDSFPHLSSWLLYQHLYHLAWRKSIHS